MLRALLSSSFWSGSRKFCSIVNLWLDCVCVSFYLSGAISLAAATAIRVFVSGGGLQESATLEWELKGRDAAGGAVAGGLQELLTAADGDGGNTGVVDLMVR